MELANGRSKLEELEKVITEFQDQLFSFAFFRTGNFADSQDIVQDVFIKLYHENNNLDSIKNIKHYLYRSIANACVDYHRKSKKLQFESIDTASLPNHLQEKDISENMIQIEEYKRINKLLTDLPDEQADVIRLRIFDNLSFVEIASILEIPITTIKSRFKYGIDKLKVGVTTQKEVKYGL
ncbi:MAG TPA: sigma-70 family RNA polymerase sigma factor [Tenuifilaceae bacterium]|nr:sigma-70 family RNA polymerase sigma factor [Tenuifilaceae bacterium]HPN20484.1 sigma-70 family RNA polymerase sigma factor [Tenuifilaceae bacterium]